MTKTSHSYKTLIPILMAALGSARDQLEQFVASDKDRRDRDLRKALKEVNAAIAEASEIETLPVGHTPGPWQHEDQFIVAPDPEGKHVDIYIAEIATDDETGRVASPEQQQANGKLLAAAPTLLEAAQLVIQRWSKGDLADAVRMLDCAVVDAGGKT